MTENQLIPSERVQAVMMDIPLDELPDNSQLVGPEPTKEFVESVNVYGVLQPIILIDDEGAAYRVVAGRRRIKAAREVGMVSIPAVIYPDEWTLSEVLSLVENQQRGQNIASDVLSVGELLHSGYGEQAICEAVGVTPAQLRARLRLLGMHPILLQGLIEGEIAPSVAESAAKLSPYYQSQLADTLANEGRVTMKDVREVQQARNRAAEEALPDALFDVTEQQGWRVQVNSLIAQIERLVPPEGNRERLDSLIRLMRAALGVNGDSAD